MPNHMFILYVADQARARAFYNRILGVEPSLDVPGMTEYALSDGVSLGLLPYSGMAGILGDHVPNPASGQGIPRCELYLFVDDPQDAIEHLVAEGGKLIAPPARRSWGDIAAYGADLDGHIIAFAKHISLSA